MTNKEIKKALECCSNPSINFCKNCPYNNNGEFSCCDGEMHKDALNLVTEQEKEINQLKTECTLLDDELRNARQETINVLNELKAKSYVNDYCREVVEVEKIDELIAEVQNAEDKSRNREECKNAED